MKMIKKRSLVTYYLLSILTLGIYAIVFWHKLAKDVNVLCEGDGKKTMKYFPAWLLGIVTGSIFVTVWKAKLGSRLQYNAERYGLRFSESGGLVAAYSVLGIVGSHIILVKNFNRMAEAYNAYNGLVDPEADKKTDLFAD